VLVESVEGVAALRTEFEHLQTVTKNRLPFALFDWQLAWCRHFLNRQADIVEKPLFHVIRTASGRCVAIVPLIQTQRRLGPFHVRSVCMLGADPAITEIRTALVEPGYEEAAARLVHGSLSHSLRRDWVEWTGLGDAFGAAIGQLRGLSWEPLQPSYVVDLPTSWSEFHRGLKRNIRESLRHCYNSLKRAGHTFELRVDRDPGAVREALPRFLELHEMRAKMTGAPPHSNRFATPELQAFLSAVCGELALCDVVRVFQLVIGGQVVASRIGFVVRDSLYLYYSGFDPQWASFSVMTTVVAEAIKYAISVGLTTVNLSAGTDVSKTRWGPRALAYQTAYEPGPGLRSRLTLQAYRNARSGGGLQGWLLQRLGPGRHWD
jgi:CelD/BcsL family acetyltransferase involved in cellulose biosynthesis